MGRSILEVWDYRLSEAQPINYRGQKPVIQPNGGVLMEETGTWVAVVWPQNDRGEPLEVHDTGVPVEPGDTHDGPGLDACYAFYRSVRDKYSRPDIEELKPAVASIRKADLERQAATDAYNEKLQEINGMRAQ